MNLTSENTAIVLDSTSDFPDAAERFPNMRVVPLYVNFGPESFRDHVDIGSHDFYERLREAPALPTTSQPTPQDFLDVYEQLAGYERIYALQLSAKLSGTYQSAVAAAGEIGGDRIRVVDTETASLAVGLLALAIQRRLARGTTDEEIEALIERFKEENGVVFTVATLEYLQKGGRIGRAQALAGTLLNVKPILSVDDGVDPPDRQGARPPEGARGVRPRLHDVDRERARAADRDRPRRRAGVDRGADRPRREGAPAGGDRARREPRRRRRHPCRPGRGRLLLVPGRRRSAAAHATRPRLGAQSSLSPSFLPPPDGFSVPPVVVVSAGRMVVVSRPEKTARGLSFPTGSCASCVRRSSVKLSAIPATATAPTSRTPRNALCQAMGTGYAARASSRRAAATSAGRLPSSTATGFPSGST